MRIYCRRTNIHKRLKEEFKNYNDGWWWYYSDYYNSSWNEEYDEQNYGYVDADVYLNKGKYQPYRELDMDSIYSKEKRRDKKIEKILNNSVDRDYTTTLRDFFNNGKNSR